MFHLFSWILMGFWILSPFGHHFAIILSRQFISSVDTKEDQEDPTSFEARAEVCQDHQDLRFSTNSVFGGFPKIMVPQNGWFRMENPIKMDDLGIPLFLETSINSFFISICFLSDWSKPAKTTTFVLQQLGTWNVKPSPTEKSSGSKVQVPALQHQDQDSWEQLPYATFCCEHVGDMDVLSLSRARKFVLDACGCVHCSLLARWSQLLRQFWLVLVDDMQVCACLLYKYRDSACCRKPLQLRTQACMV